MATIIHPSENLEIRNRRVINLHITGIIHFFVKHVLRSYNKLQSVKMGYQENRDFSELTLVIVYHIQGTHIHSLLPARSLSTLQIRTLRSSNLPRKSTHCTNCDPPHLCININSVRSQIRMHNHCRLVQKLQSLRQRRQPTLNLQLIQLHLLPPRCP